MPELSAIAWTMLAVGAVIVGLSKTALPGSTTITVAAFAAILPAKESTGTLLILLVVGDIFAVLTWRRHANWTVLKRLVPTVLIGLALGALFLALASNTSVRYLIGVILLAVIALTLIRRRLADRSTAEESRRTQRLQAIGYGSLAGFTTMVANAAGPVMSMYFFASRFSVKAFLGTAAWFYAVVNLIKVPISASLGLITRQTLTIDLFLVPAVVVGALVGRRIAEHLNQRVFDRIIITLTILGALYLLV